VPANDFLEQGLTSAEAQKRLEKFGRNELAKKGDFSSLRVFFSQFKSPLIYILVFAGLIAFFLKDFADATVIFAAVFLNTVLGFYQEQKAQKAMAALSQFLSPKTKVIRNGQKQEIEASQLVPGDLVVLTIGTRVPADGVLVEATDFSLNEAILTGESMPVEKKKTSVLKDLALVRERQFKKENQVFMGTTVTTGIAKMLVLKTGMETKIGQIGQSLGEIKLEKTPLQAQLAHLAKVLAVLVGAITLLIFLFGEYLGYQPLEMFMTSVAIAVAAIPEGLVVSLTVILALGMQRIFKKKALVRRLLAAETLGSVSTICCDKTGTLTEGKMQVVKSILADDRLLTKKALIKAAVLCNDLRDPLEVAMLDWARKQSRKFGYKDTKSWEEDYPRKDEIPFSPNYKYIATLHQDNFTKKDNLLFFSGAPEVILARSQETTAKKEARLKEFEELGKKGYRLVGFAYKKCRKSKTKIQKADLKDFEWLGILVYEDPIRKGVAAALKETQKAGIKIKVITGDYLSTAVAVLKQLDFKFDQDSQVMEGRELEKITDEQLKKKVNEVVLFARTTPKQKLKIVEALKKNGEVVAMTGDGVNDAPAVKMADIGIVMGEASDVAKETADMVLLDSNFKTIVAAVETGRTIFENIRKVVLYLLSDSFTEVILIGGSLLLGLPLPVSAVQILWVNLVEDALPAMALAFEKGEKGLMKEPPRKKGTPILNTELKTLIFIIGILNDLLLLVLFGWLLRGFLHLHHIRTVIFVALGINSLFYVFACRSLRRPFFRYRLWDNWFLNFSVLSGFALLFLAVYFPPLQTLLKTHPLDLKEWVLLVSIGLFNFFAIELTKWVFIIRQKEVKIKI